MHGLWLGLLIWKNVLNSAYSAQYFSIKWSYEPNPERRLLGKSHYKRASHTAAIAITTQENALYWLNCSTKNTHTPILLRGLLPIYVAHAKNMKGGRELDI